MTTQWDIPGDDATTRAYRFGLARAAHDYLIRHGGESASLWVLEDHVYSDMRVDGSVIEHLEVLAEECPWFEPVRINMGGGRTDGMMVTEAGHQALREDPYREHPDREPGDERTVAEVAD